LRCIDGDGHRLTAKDHALNRTSGLCRALKNPMHVDDDYATLSGECEPWPSRAELTACLLQAGLKLGMGTYSISVEGCQRFKFKVLGGDIGPPMIEAEADTASALERDAALVSNALTAADVRHRFEVYDGACRLTAYFHHRWPRG